MTIELFVLLAFAIVAQSAFARFEIETSPSRKIFKWSAMSALTLGLSLVIGHWALLVPVLLGAAGTTFHIVWCRRNSIDPVRATPRRRYYELRGWPWPFDAN